MSRRVAVTGLGVVSPVGVGTESFWSAVKAGNNGVTEIPASILQILPGLRTRSAAGISEHWLAQPKGSGARVERLGTIAFRQALDDAGLASLQDVSSGLVFGTAVGDTAGMERSFVSIDERGAFDFTKADTHLFNTMHFHATAAEWARSSRCEGPTIVVSTGCTAGIDSFGIAFDLVRNNRVDVAVCGAADAPLTPIVFAAFDALGALSKRDHDVTRASRPFDRTRDGFVLGEGAGVLVLEEYEHALRRGAKIYAEASGFSSLSNGFHMTDLPSDGKALARCFEQAILDAGIRACEIDCVNAHGSSTKQNDVCETSSIAAVLGDQAENVSVNSLKAMVGHALGASNAIELVACALSIHEQFVFPTINLDHPDPDCYLDYVPNRGRKRRIRHLAKLSNGFSGIHSTAILSRAT
ncbi:beta-ketoacyl-[acyl-carrier-protein] synthase family protein [Bradyrhizobium tropiciagri]|uniref:beta-ketoacyl-[acyl-carrier-protein] synthase family protein n=1 Tax=Bradyrhizobium tropiciagri TaxID=312253 RepID=UPI00067C6D66|nr:beta-ketoacyl-[acyl-carrier-protein] synthase family protein [Bradyrhizobium tropiciagri]